MLKYFGKLKSFILLEIEQKSESINVWKNVYSSEIIEKYGIIKFNETLNPMAKDSDIRPLLETERRISRKEQKLFRHEVSEII